MAYKKHPNKKRRYPFKRQLRRKLRRITFMVIAAALAGGINYYHKKTSSDENLTQNKLSKLDNLNYFDSGASLSTDPETLYKLEQARKNTRSKLWVTVHGTVIKRLKDDLVGSQHQKFLIKIDDNFTLLVSHNIDLAPRAPINKGDPVSVSGLYEWNNRGGVIHWTHHDPKGKKKGGWIKINGKHYD